MGVQKWRDQTKKNLVDGFGGKCNRCGYCKCQKALEFHHLADKKFSISSVMKCPMKWEKIVEEVRKCILLCSNCHRELHDGIWKLKEISIVKFVDNHSKFKKDVPTGFCPICNKEVFFGRKCCSSACAGRLSWKINWPTKEELGDMLKSMNRCQIARTLGVSEMAVRKRIKKYNIVL